MSWVRLDDAIFGNRKMVEISGPAKLLHIVAICHSAQGLTDGRVSKRAFATIAAQAEAQKRHAAELVEVQLWHDEGTHWVINDYLEYNPSRDKVLSDREAAKIRKERWRERVAERVPDAVTDSERTPRVRVPRTRTPNNNPPSPPMLRVVDDHSERFVPGTGWVREA